jgi:hypothetical protein
VTRGSHGGKRCFEENTVAVCSCEGDIKTNTNYINWVRTS